MQDWYEIRMKFLRILYDITRILYEFVPLCTFSLSYSALITFRYLIMSQKLSQLAFPQSRPKAAANTLA